MTSIEVICPKCGRPRVYMGRLLEVIETAKRPIRIRCSRCGASIRLNKK